MLVFRAIENRVPIVRAANTGFSAVIDSDGSIREKTALFTPDVRTVPLRWAKWTTFYSAWGDLFARLCLGLALVLVAYASILRRKDHERNAR